MKQIRQLIVSMCVVLLVASCSEFSKVLKSDNPDYKYTKAMEYYQAKEYHKALALLEELIGLLRGTSKAEDVYYYYAQTHYYLKDYYLANYYFNSFYKTFTNSPRAEECLFNAAVCSSKLSPEYSLDQNDTRSSINEFQLFLDTYPRSVLRDSANKMIDQLSFKLEKKEYESVKLYFQTERYKAAVFAMERFLKDFPGSTFSEEVRYLMVKSYFLYAEGSIEEKKLERYRSSTESYLTFATAFPQSKWLKEAEVYYERSRREIEKLSSQSRKT